MPTTLAIRRADGVRRETCAWLAPGSDPRAWLDEVSAWGIPLKGLLLHALPSAALVTSVGNVAPRVSPAVLPYGCVAGRLYLPVDAVIEPPVAEDELALLLPVGATFVWHPSAGLVRFEESERLRVAELLAPSPPRESLWNAADPGIMFSKRLTSVEPDAVPSIGEILSAAGGDIATEPPTLSNLPPAPGERRGGLRRLRDWLRRPNRPSHEPGSGDSRRGQPAPGSSSGGSLAGGALRAGAGLLGGLMGLAARAALKFTSRAAPTASSPTWVNGLENWANGVLNRLSAANPFARMREIQRLLHMLETDPHEGLRHAIPFGDGSGRRGNANPSNQLGARDADFDSRRLAGGGPADYWDLPNEYRLRLQQKYRELALRETSLGRHRRAAFIYAELLGDFASAAAVLAAGRHHREAAVLYREKLNQPLQAARCLEEGGLLAEAAALFEELGEHERAGDVHRRLDDAENADRCYEAALGVLARRSDFLSAAALAEKKLRRPDQALELLRSGWSHEPQAQACLEGWFQTCGRHARHEAAGREVERFRRDAIEARLVAPVAETLSKAAAAYPDQAVCRLAETATRSIVSRRLEACEPQEAKRLIAAVTRLAPQDRLLTRDGERHVRDAERVHAARLAARPKLPSLPTRRPGSPDSAHVRLTPCTRIALSPHVEWKTAAAAGRTFYVAGHRGDMLVVSRGFWQSTHRELPSVNWRPVDPDAEILLAPDPQDAQPLFVHVAWGPPLMDRAFPPVDRSPIPLPASSPLWAFEETMAIVRDSSGKAYTVSLLDGGEIFLSCYDGDGVPIASDPIPAPQNLWEDRIHDGEVIVRLWVGENIECVSIDRHLFLCSPIKRRKTIEFPGLVQSLSGSPPHTRTRVVATFDQGAAVVWGPDLDHRVQTFADDMESPHACFTVGGWLVAAGEREIRAYRAEDGRVQEVGRIATVNGRVFAVLPTGVFGQFAVCSAAHGPLGASCVTLWQVTQSP